MKGELGQVDIEVAERQRAIDDSYGKVARARRPGRNPPASRPVRPSVAALLAVACVWPTAAAAAAPLTVTEIAPGYSSTRDRTRTSRPKTPAAIANLGFVVGERSVAVIDSGGSLRQGEALLAAIRQRTSLPVSHVIDTHVHPDHLFGNGAFAHGSEIVGHANLAQRLAENGLLPRPACAA